MQSFDVSQQLLALEAKYDVRRLAEENEKQDDQEILMTLKGTEAIMRLYEGDEGTEKASFRMRSILSDTKFEVFDSEGNSVAFFAFPLLEIRKKFHLTIGGDRYEGVGGMRGHSFRFHDEHNKVVLEIQKRASFRDRYKVHVTDPIPVPIALLATAVVDQKYFERRG